MANKTKDIFKLVFVWGAIIVGLVGFYFKLDLLIIICIFMLAVVFISVRYITMREKLQKKDKIDTSDVEK